MAEKKLKPITNKILWIFAVGQFGWSLLSGIISTWLVHLYTGVPANPGDTNGLFARFISQNPLIASLTPRLYLKLRSRTVRISTLLPPLSDKQ